MTDVTATILAPGLADPVHDSQQFFRRILEAMSRPGRIVDLSAQSLPAVDNLMPAMAAIALTLLDQDSPAWIDPAFAAAAGHYIGFHTGAPRVTDAGKATFVLVADGRRLPDLMTLARGDAAYPERGATLVVQVAGLKAGDGCRLTGPGIDGAVDLDIAGLAPEFWQAFAANAENFPLGFDTILICGTRITALPRTSRRVDISGKA